MEPSRRPQGQGKRRTMPARLTHVASGPLAPPVSLATVLNANGAVRGAPKPRRGELVRAGAVGEGAGRRKRNTKLDCELPRAQRRKSTQRERSTACSRPNSAHTQSCRSFAAAIDVERPLTSFQAATRSWDAPRTLRSPPRRAVRLTLCCNRFVGTGIGTSQVHLWAQSERR